MTRKAHLKINKVSVDFLISVLMAIPDSLLVLAPSALISRRKGDFSSKDVVVSAERSSRSRVFIKCFMKY